jgi:PTS system galactitol-specific IIA component
MAEVIISEKLIKLGMTERSKGEVIRALAAGLYENDYVREGYVENVIQREETFPTGLPTSIPVALCHTEAQYVKQSSMAVGTLAAPVPFLEMGTPEQTVQAEIVFLLALNDPKDQVPWLKKMAAIFKDHAVLQSIRLADDPVKLAEMLNELFRA